MSQLPGVAMDGNPPTTVQRLRMSWEEYLALPDKPKAEWVDGEVIVNVPVAPDYSASLGLALLFRQSLPDCKV